MTTAADADFMRLALRLAEKGHGKTSPNPLVGSVIVQAGNIVGTGYHRALGAPHAEVVAIRKAGKKASGATLYVNLEPCCHTGRTGPCTESIIGAGISRVVLSLKDPNPLVNGKGIAAMRRAGISVQSGCLRKEAEWLNDSYLGYHARGRPYVILKLAQSFDGKIATSSGDSRWISSPASRKYIHHLRAGVDAVVVGGSTVRRDDPALTVRHVRGRNPYRIIITESLDIPRKSRLLASNEDARTIIASCKSSIRRFTQSRTGRSLIYWTVKRKATGLLDLSDFVARANDFGIRSLLVEGGGRLATAFMRAGLVDKFVSVTAPIIVGDGIDSFGDLGVSKIGEAMRFNTTREWKSGPDRIVIGYLTGK